MCGINGIIFKSNSKPEYCRDLVTRMNGCITHRGPDEEGVYSDEYCGMGMRRLSIIDLSTGSQPIFNENGNKLIVFNGEIYNYRELQRLVIEKGHQLKTASDTEVVLHLFEEYGEDCVERLDGMFAFAIYDKESREVFIARDRAGEKPLYYYHTDTEFGFSSELKAITKGLGKVFTLDLSALNIYLSLTYIPAPMTIFSNVHKLEAGHWMKLNSDGLRIQSYWDVRPCISNSIANYEEAKRHVRGVMSQSVEAMMVSDVPLGAFLSGGVDSSIVTGLMSKISSKKIRTFSVGFTLSEYDETYKAKAVSAFHGTDHNVITLDYSDAINWLDKILDNMDEPFADSSCIPTYFVSQFARNHVKVVLTGDGGDEMFAGYSKYLVGYYTGLYNRLPKVISEGIFEPVLESLPDTSSMVRKMKKVVRSKNDDLFEQRKRLMQLGFSEESPLLKPNCHKDNALGFIEDIYHGSGIEDELTRTLYTDMRVVLEGDMLAKVDRMSMLASIETRAPFLSKDMMELAFRLPSRFKIKGRNQKVILKDTFSDMFPPGMINRTKQGFGVPVGEWFKGPLKQDLLQTLNSERLKEQGIFQPDVVEEMMKQHFEESENHSFRLWTLYVFQKWYEKYYQNGAV